MMHHRVTKQEYEQYRMKLTDAAIRDELTCVTCLDKYGQLVTRVNGIPNAWQVNDKECTKFYILK